jgi:molybdopterin synthase sulfur carrier subunit
VALVKLKFKLYATLAGYLPPGAVDNVVEVDVPDTTTPHELLDHFGVPRARAHLVLRNGVFVPPGTRDDRVLRDGDSLAIWPPVAGG